MSENYYSNKDEKIKIPHDFDAEKSVLGAMIRDVEALETGKSILNASDFYNPNNAEIFSAILAVHAEGIIVDFVTLGDELTKRNSLEKIGGALYLTEIVQSVVTSAYIEHHAKIVKDLAKRRHAQIIGEKLFRQAETLPLEEINLLSQSISSAVAPKSKQDTPQWPEMDKAAYHGLAGKIVDAIKEHTEADPAAILLQFLIFFGNVIGRTAHWTEGFKEHYCNLFGVVVGDSSEGRKGSSLSVVKRIFREINSEWLSDCLVYSGLVSGQGIKSNLRDSSEDINPDKRVLFIEEEFSRLLAVTKWHGSDVSQTIRTLFDSEILQSFSRKDPFKCSGVHGSIIGHITQEELIATLSNSEILNGFANRFMWILSKRSRFLPHGSTVNVLKEIEPQLIELRQSIEFSKNLNSPLNFDKTTDRQWPTMYRTLTSSVPGRLNSIITRRLQIVRRLAVSYAALDCISEVNHSCLEAALAVWTYCEKSAEYIFSQQSGNETADTILAAISHDGITPTYINKQLFHGHKKSHEIRGAIESLKLKNLISEKSECTGGRTETRYFRNDGM